MRAKDIMTKQTHTIQPERNLVEAAREMKEYNVGALPVYNDGKLVGMVTDRDIVVRSLAERGNPNEQKVENIMTPGTECCPENDDVEEVASQMVKRNVRRIPVINDEQTIVGIVSLGDISEKGNKILAGEVLKKLSAAPPQQ